MLHWEMKKQNKMALCQLQQFIYPHPEFYRNVAAIALPIALQNTITMAVNLTDTLMVGKLGETCLSAASLANQFILFMQTMIMGLSMGASVLIARYWGMKKLEPLRRVVAIQLRLAVLIAAFFCFVTACFPTTIMMIYTDEAAIIAGGAIYLRWSVFTYFFHAVSLSCTIILRNIQWVKVPMLASVGAFFVNIFGNYAFIFGKLGAPRMGIGGAAISTLLVRVFECAIIAGYLLFVEKQLCFRIKDLALPTRKLIPEYISIGLPVLFSDFLMALANNIVMMIIGRMGGSFVAANAATVAVVNITNVVIQGIGQSSSIITGNALGRGEQDVVQRQGMAFFGLGIFIGLLMSVLIVLMRPLIGNLYHLLPETASIAGELMLAIAVINVFQAANSILTKGVFRGGGDTKTLMVADSIFMWIAAIPLGALCGLWLQAPPFWVYISLKSDNILKCVWCWHRIKGDRWIKKIA